MLADSDGLNLGHILGALGVSDSREVLVLRHTASSELDISGQVNPADVLEYTRIQGGRKVPASPPATWLVFLADGARRSRFFIAYENRGELIEHRTADLRHFDLHPSSLFQSMRNRLVVEWSKDTINWAKSGTSASAFPVVEIADPEVVPFPGYDRVFVTHEVLRAVIEDSRYARWRTALGSVQGIYLIADTSTGRLYVGKADGRERILGRWTEYARDGHGGNLALRGLAKGDPKHARHFVFSILRVFSPAAIASEVDEAESHYKNALGTRKFGLNLN